MKRILKDLHLKQIIIFMMIIIGSFAVFSFSKYVIEEYHGYFLNSKHFYFSSNRLTEEHPLYQVNNWSGVGTFDISFNILSVKNSFVYSDYDIPYTVWFDCPTTVTCTVSDRTMFVHSEEVYSDSIYTNVVYTYPAYSGTVYTTSLTHSDAITLTVTPRRTFNENEHLVIKAYAESYEPYVKRLSADFEYIVGKQGVTYQIDDVANEPYLMLKVTNAISYCKVMQAFGNYTVDSLIDSTVYINLPDADKSKCVSQVISLDYSTNLLRLDTTSKLLDSATYTTETLSGSDFIDHLVFNIGPLSTIGIKFYKVDPTANYSYPNNNNNPSIITFATADPS